MQYALIALGIVAEIVVIAAAVQAIRVFSRVGSAAERIAEGLDTRLAAAAEQAGKAMADVSEAARELRARSEQVARALREVETIFAALGVLVGAREIVAPTVSSMVSAGMRRLSGWLSQPKPAGGERHDER